MKAKLKIFKSLSISLSLVAVLSACNLPSRPGLPTQITDQNPVDFVATMTLYVKPTQTGMVIITPVNVAPMSTPILPGTPVWSVYDYTCELAIGGGTMTMNLAWTDRSENEDGYKIYRNEKVIATLASNSTFYIDVAFVPAGKTLSYSVEAFNTDWRVSTSTITHGCQ